jgi:hypothetical protein
MKPDLFTQLRSLGYTGTTSQMALQYRKDPSVVIDKSKIDSKTYGLVADGVADDTAALQAIIDSTRYGSGVPTVGCDLPAGSILITNTITINRKSFYLRGRGCGNTPQSSNPGGGTKIIWGGPSGIPMFHVYDTRHLVFEDMAIVGHNTNIPSDGIYFESTSGAGVGTNSQLYLRRILFGKTLEDTTNWYQQYCVRFGGLNANNDQFRFDDCIFSQPSVAGVQIEQGQSIWGLLVNPFFSGNFVSKGLRTNAGVQLINATFDANVIDFEVGYTIGGPTVAVYGYFSERSLQPVSIPQYSTRFHAVNGLVMTTNASTDVGGSGYILDAASLQAEGDVVLENLRFFHQSGTRPSLRVRAPSIGATAGGHVFVRNCNLVETDLDITCVNNRGIFVSWEDNQAFSKSRVINGGTWTPVVSLSTETKGVTGSRPSAVTAGSGYRFYDTTLSKPIWSDGTVWRDAAGTSV